MNVTAKVDIKPAVDTLERVQRDQVPFAVSLALTRTAQLAQKAVIASLPDRFRDRGTGLNWIRQGIRITAAKKSNLQATVYAKDWFLGDQEAGGDRSPLTAQFQRVPGALLAGVELKPRLSDLIGQPATFIAANDEGEEFVGRRVGKAAYPIEVLYFPRQSVHLTPRLGMTQTVGKVVAESFPAEFQKAADVAMTTAR